jgi:hypothetical protein
MRREDFPVAFNGGFRPAVTKIRCPKCRCKNIQLTEFVEASTTFQVTDGKLNREDGIHELGNFIGRMAGKCDGCGHLWALRKASEIETVVTELDPKTFRPLYEDIP